jgi:hypothetical protein
MERVGRVLGLRAATVRERLVVAHVQPLAYARGSYERIRGAFGVKRRVWVAAAFGSSGGVCVRRRRLRLAAVASSGGGTDYACSFLYRVRQRSAVSSSG